MKKLTIAIIVILVFLFLLIVTTIIIADREEAKKPKQPTICKFEVQNYTIDFKEDFTKDLNSSIS